MVQSKPMVSETVPPSFLSVERMYATLNAGEVAILLRVFIITSKGDEAAKRARVLPKTLVIERRPTFYPVLGPNTIDLHPGSINISLISTTEVAVAGKGKRQMTTF